MTRVCCWIMAGVFAGCSVPDAPVDVAEEQGEPILLSVWEPSPDEAVERMLEMTGLQAGETHFDLGSGDGRFVVAAAKRGAQSTGYEIDPELIAQSRARIAAEGLEDRARIVDEDLLKAEFERADVITMYLTPESYPPLMPLLEEKLRDGARVATYKFPAPGWTPDRVERWRDEDPDIPLHEAFFYRR